MLETFCKVRSFLGSSTYNEIITLKQKESELFELNNKLKGVDVVKVVETLNQLQSLMDTRSQLQSAKNQSFIDEKTQLDVFNELQKQVTDNEKLVAFYKEALEALTKEYLGNLSGTLTDVYCSVYNSVNKSVQLTMEDYRGKKVIRLNVINSYEGQLYKEDLGNDGGSAQLIMGTVVAIYFILATGMPRIIFFDESVSALATVTLHRYLAVLRKFVDELDFTFVVIEHAAYRLKGYVDQVYTIENGEYKEVPSEYIDTFIEATRGDEE